MKTFCLSLILILAANTFAEVEIQLATGSRFKGEIKKLTSRFVIVQTKIGELKLTKDMLSPACRASLKAYANSKPSSKKVDVNVKVSYKEKTLVREKSSFRRGGKRVFKEKAAVLTIRFDALPGGKNFSGRVEYEFTAEHRGAKKGKIIVIDKGIKSFDLQANERNPEVIIQSKSVSHLEASHTGDTLIERGIKLKGYRVKVYLEGNLVFEGEK